MQLPGKKGGADFLKQQFGSFKARGIPKYWDFTSADGRVLERITKLKKTVFDGSD